MKGTSKKKAEDDYMSDDSDLDEEEKAAIRMLTSEQRKMLAELEQAGANKAYIKKKIKASLMQ